ncbi:MAG: HEAT repeat domain-containing protein [Elusimicrobia bacterium]|nr:HEAT repeat domain-containing protein [Elusimicrobiota bacterium]
MRIFRLNQKMTVFFSLGILLFVASPCCPAGAGATADVPAILNGFLSKDIAIGKKAADESWKLGESDVPALLKELENDDINIRMTAVHILANMGADTRKRLGGAEKEVVSALKNLLKSEHKRIRHAAAVGLARIDPSLGKELLPVLIEVVQDGGKYRLGAVQILDSMGSEAKDAVPTIIERINKTPKLEHSFYYEALKQIGTPEALEFSKHYVPENNIPYPVSSEQYLYISDKPLLNTFITLVFVFLFWWSRRRRRAGIKLIYWPLLIPVIVWGFNIALAIETSKDIGVPFGTIMISSFMWSVIMVATLLGIIPWLVSVLIWRKKHTAPGAPASRSGNSALPGSI